MRYLPLSLTLTLLLSACGTVPEVKRYEPQTNKAFAATSEPLSAVASDASTREPGADFWLGFQDDELTRLVNEALKANPDIRTAQASLAEARASARNSVSQLYPTVSATGGANRARFRDQMGGQSSITESTFNAGFDVFWEAELFGRVSKDVKIATDASVTASEALLRASQITIAAEVTRNYMELRGLQAERAVTTVSIEKLARLLTLVEARLAAGRANAIEAERTKSQLMSAQSAIAALDGAIIRTRFRLAVLTHQVPTALDQRLSMAKPLPGVKATSLSAIGTPESLLARRPDVLAAEKQALNAAARVGIARSQFVPRITLSGALGLNSGRLLDLDTTNFVYNLGAQVVYKLFDSGRTQSAVDAAAARGDAAIINYERVVLGALEETEAALVTYTQLQRQVEQLFKAGQSADKATELSMARLNVGVSDALSVLNAEQEALQVRARLAQTQTAAATALIGVYKALAGGVTQ